MEQPIYKIITLTIDNNHINHELFGWYHTKEDALKSVECNSCDMQDQIFNYVLVSRSYPGGYGICDEELAWFEWNHTDEKWETCERPEACDGLKFV